ncbi:uncharacterized protein NEPG_02360 [Nematocida parisii ERTm1]|uniref:uncharacterized protein n=1 Tax=Nematocida parisii (strain ERTm1 / ATCC PRA-289) TaxID=881290 RepID=UPI000264B26F|nr:uncharacterized protein NEPG_02360 [Nematocida parisii ERTm1]EIJ92961.1 hypothetical protein NEPG_02360 [Nematocida parisii ERTm1]|eukprot:XP_013060187.1 hypothetical protein NEPG_02360 [Nematocida parisii ERTm1]
MIYINFTVILNLRFLYFKKIWVPTRMNKINKVHESVLPSDGILILSIFEITRIININYFIR